MPNFVTLMTHREALSLIDTPYLRSNKTPTHWADLGCGSGTFTLALADLLAPGSTIEAIDLRPGVAAQTTSNGVTIHPRTADFTTLNFTFPAPAPPGPTAGPRDRTPAPIPDRLWPGHHPLAFDGILMANSLHYVRDQHEFLANLRTNTLLLIEYDIDVPVARWVPYPLSYSKAVSLLTSTHWPRIQKLGTLPSAFGRSELYAALALRIANFVP
jgi:SAM-dependent methyltransferase